MCDVRCAMCDVRLYTAINFVSSSFAYIVVMDYAGIIQHGGEMCIEAKKIPPPE